MELNKELFTRIEKDKDSVIQEFEQLSQKDKVTTLFYIMDTFHDPDNKTEHWIKGLSNNLSKLLKSNKESLLINKSINGRVITVIGRVGGNVYKHTEDLINEFFNPNYDGLSNDERLDKLDLFIDKNYQKK